MNDGEQLARFFANFEKLCRNRERVPLERLRTEYARSYQALVAQVTQDADWFADRYLETFAENWPRDPLDAEGNALLDERVSAICQEENQPQKLRDCWREALIDRLDFAEFGQFVIDRYERCYAEAYVPYFQKHCRWLPGKEPGEQIVYNDAADMYFLPPSEEWPEGRWFCLADRMYYNAPIPQIWK